MAQKSVFIGNIPYGGTEELIIDTLSRVGQVVNFRLVYDKDTGRPKGFGFAEFSDADAAASAVRNLNDYEIMGRKLRVDWSNDNGAGDNAPAGYTAAPTANAPTNGQPDAASTQPSSTLPPLPPGADLPPNLTCPDAISRTLSTIPAAQLLDILSQMKGLVTSDPAKAAELLKQAPQLSYAIFQALLLLNLVDTSILSTIIEQAAAPPAATPAPVPVPPVVQPPRAFPQYAPPAAPTPPVSTPQFQPPPVLQPQAQAPVMDQGELLRQVLQMTPEQINQLPPDARAQIAALRQGIMAGGAPRF